MADYKNALKKNPDEAARNARPVMYTQSLDGSPPASEYTSKKSTTEGPTDTVMKKAPRNKS
jgi:hypothetical protein